MSLLAGLGQLVEVGETDATTGGGLVNYAEDPATITPIVPARPHLPPRTGPRSMPSTQPSGFLDWLQHSTIDILGIRIPSWAALASVVVGTIYVSKRK